MLQSHRNTSKKADTLTQLCCFSWGECAQAVEIFNDCSKILSTQTGLTTNREAKFSQSLMRTFWLRQIYQNIFEGKNIEFNLSMGVAFLDFDSICDAWDHYVRGRPDLRLTTIAGYSATRAKKWGIARRLIVLGWKRDYLIKSRGRSGSEGEGDGEFKRSIQHSGRVESRQPPEFSDSSYQISKDDSTDPPEQQGRFRTRRGTKFKQPEPKYMDRREDPAWRRALGLEQPLGEEGGKQERDFDEGDESEELHAEEADEESDGLDGGDLLRLWL